MVVTEELELNESHLWKFWSYSLAGRKVQKYGTIKLTFEGSADHSKIPLLIWVIRLISWVTLKSLLPGPPQIFRICQNLIVDYPKKLYE